MRKLQVLACLTLMSITTPLWSQEKPAAGDGKDIYARDNLVAWCIVPFDGKKRGPAERAEMCARLGLKRVAYDWRDEHVATFEQEILEYKKNGLDYFAFWGNHEDAFRLFEKYDLHPQIWIMLPAPKAETQEARVEEAATAMLPLLARAQRMKCKVGFYNHGGWHGEPENMIAVCDYLRKNHAADHVGIVYNQHHAHDRIDDFAAVIAKLKPYLLCLNLNGMTRNGDKQGKKILPLGEGELDVSLLKSIRSSGYTGPIGIIGHTQDDVEQRLQDNLDGLEWIRPQLAGRRAGPKPKLRTWSPEQAAPAPQIPGSVLKGRDEYRKAPLTVECRVTLSQKENYNILVASDTKASGQHWEVFTVAGSGIFTVYTPGLKPDHTHSPVMLCDGKTHTVGMTFAPSKVQLWVDGKLVVEQEVASSGRAGIPGGLAIGRLVEGGLGHTGTIEWVRISNTVRDEPWSKSEIPPRDEETLLIWSPAESPQKSPQKSPEASPASATPNKTGVNRGKLFGPTPEYSQELVSELLKREPSGDAARGLMVFADAKSACLGCHKVGKHGGTAGPALTEIGKQRQGNEIVESVIWPKRHVRPEYQSHMIATADGVIHKGYVVREDAKEVVLHDPTKGADHQVTIPVDQIDDREQVGSLMPDNLTAAISERQLVDLLHFLRGLGREGDLSLAQAESVLQHAQAHAHGAAPFDYDLAPLVPEQWSHWKNHVNRDRIFNFYQKEARHFRDLAASGKLVPPVVAPYPGMDGGEQGHWGNQDETTWASDAWNDAELGVVQAGIFRGNGVTVPRGVCVQLGDDQELACCFNPDTLTYDAAWSGDFLKFSSVRHGFMNGVLMAGRPVGIAEGKLNPKGKPATGEGRYLGYYQVGKRVVFRYEIDGVEYLDSPWVSPQGNGGVFVRDVTVMKKHPLVDQLKSMPRQQPEFFETTIRHGESSTPYVVDTIEMPMDNPWKVPMFGGGVGCAKDGKVYLCTMHGDVWSVEGIQYPSKTAVWTRFASGLHHCLGIIVDDDGIFVLGRDQLTRLHDINGDGEADYYECFSNAYQTSPAGHDFICGLVRGTDGAFYTASGNQGIVRIARDGKTASVVATGFRNPDGIGMTADGVVTVPCSEGEWTPATMICAFDSNRDPSQGGAPFFGFRGPQNGQVPDLPLAYLPRGLDNSAGGQQLVTSDRWGPLKGQMLHFSFGTGTHFLLLQDEVNGQMQGAISPLPGDFESGVHRACFSPADGQLYVTGMQGWGSYTPQHGCLQRVRYTGKPVQLPVGTKTFANGILIEFSDTLDKAVAEQAKSHFAQCWNYRYSSAYGSPEFSTRHYGMTGHDHVSIHSAHVVNDGKALFLELPDLQPVNQLHLLLTSNPGVEHELFVTVHSLRGESFTGAPGLTTLNDKLVLPHPILADLAMATRKMANPHAAKQEGARAITIETGTNLTYATRSITVKPGELLELTLANPDVVPHNWVLIKPGTLHRVGDLSNRLISDPEAVVRQYIPQTSDVLAFTDIVLPKEQYAIYFKAPNEPGHYPFLCTFPGHWLVMNGEMIVE